MVVSVQFPNFFCRFSYILKVPFGNEDSSGLIYVWIGSKADPEDVKLIQEIADDMFNNVSQHFGTYC